MWTAGLLPFLAALAAPSFAKGPADLSEAKERASYAEEQNIYGWGDFKKIPIAEAEFTLLDWALVWNFDVDAARKAGVVGDVDLSQDFFERATEEVYHQWRKQMAARGVRLQDKMVLQGNEKWASATEKFLSFETDRRLQNNNIFSFNDGYARAIVHPDGYKPYGKGVGRVVRMTKVTNELVKGGDMTAHLHGHMAIRMCQVKNKKTKEKTLHPCLYHLGAGGSKSDRALAATFDAFEPMAFEGHWTRRNPKFELGQVGALVGDGTIKWGKKTDPAFILTPDQVVNPPIPNFTLRGEFTEGEAAFVTELCNVLLTAEDMAWAGVDWNLAQAQAKFDKKNKKKGN